MIVTIIVTGIFFGFCYLFIFSIIQDIFMTNFLYCFRCYVIYCLPTLKFLDSTPVTRAEEEEAILRGKYFRIVKPIVLQTVSLSVN